MRIIISESNIKNFIRKKFNVDLTGKIIRADDYDDLLGYFDMVIGPYLFKQYYKKYGPFYAIFGIDEAYLYQNQDGYDYITNTYDEPRSYSELMEELKLSGLGLTIPDNLSSSISSE